MMKIVLAVCSILMLASGCSPAENRTQDESAPRTPADPQTDNENTLPEEAEEQASAELLSSLEDLLPQQFGALTRPWRGDLDGMAERHARRSVMQSGCW
jgi:hypothetical protein